MLRYFNIIPETNEEFQKLHKVIKFCYDYKFIPMKIPDNIDEISDFSYGNYNISVDSNICETYKLDDIFKKYEYVYLNNDNEKLNEIIKEKLNEQAQYILKDVLEYYKHDIEKEVKNRYDNFVKNFVEERIGPHMICSLYNNYINNELSYRINKIISLLNVDQLKQIKLYNHVNYSTYCLNVGRIKNKIVDEILDICDVRRGMKDYNRKLKFAGHIADILEHILVDKYIISDEDIKYEFNKNDLLKYF